MLCDEPDTPLGPSSPPPDSGPTRPRRIPSYRKHRASGQAVVTLGGRDFYLGTFGSRASRAEYERRLAEWLASGGTTAALASQPSLTVKDLIMAYWRHVEAYYKPETRAGTIAPTLRRLRRLYGSTRAVEFGPLALKAFRQSLLDERGTRGGRLSRSSVNRAVQWVRRMFRWAVSEELVPVTVLQALAAVEGLRRGRTNAPDHEPVAPVADAVVEATLPHLTAVVADMVRVQRLTGMRPGEVCGMRASEIDMSGAVWVFRPRSHKTAHFGHTRVVPIGPRAQAILGPYLGMDLGRPFFSPAESDRRRRSALREANQTPFTPSRLRRDAARAKRPRRRLNEAYTTSNYAQAIRRACEKAGVPTWSPNQLRHSRATELRKHFGLDAAGAVLGHAKLETTQIYAERNMELAVRVTQATG